MTWHSPLAFLILLVLVGVFLYRSSFFRKRSQGALFYADLNLFSGISSFRASLAFLPGFLRVFGLFCVVVALARPQTTDQEAAPHLQKGVDIMVVMDISLSMLVDDMGDNITRLESAKQVVGEFIRGRPQDRIGLIVFSGESFTMTPLTFDHELLHKTVSQLNAPSPLKAGTAIGTALVNATVRLKHSPENSRLIIFLTDGDNNGGFVSPEMALQVVKQNKIRVYTIGLGSKRGSFFIKYKTKSPDGTTFYKKSLIISFINEDLMSKISSQTNGLFFMAKDLVSLKEIFKTINKMETYPISLDQWMKYTEHFKNWLLPGVLFYFLSVLLSLTVFFKGV